MCRPQPYLLYNKSIQNRISIYVQQRSNTDVRRKSSNEQNRNARSSSQSDIRRDGKEKLWTTATKRLRYLVHIGQTLMDKRDRLRDIIAVSEQSEISDRDAWIEEQRHKWMCGEQPELPEDCPF